MTFALVSAGGATDGAVAVARDVTERVTCEKAERSEMATFRP